MRKVKEDVPNNFGDAQEYEKVYGEDERPLADEAPSALRMAAIEYLAEIWVGGWVGNSYLYLAAWGPRRHITMMSLFAAGQVLTRDGSIRQERICGPPSFERWAASYGVMYNACLMGLFLDLGILARYRRRIVRARAKYGKWPG